MALHSILLQSVDMFGPSRVGFVKLCADVTWHGKKVPGVCFLRGMGVGILVSLYCLETEEEYAILVQQPRIPLGESSMLEIPAGMLDGSGNFAGVAAQELQEECGIHVTEKDLIDLTELAYGNRHRGVCPSGGGCDEYLRLMYCRLPMSLEEIHSLQGKLGGLRDHGEVITLHIVRFDDIWKLCCDAKALW
jgi:ADP-sugar diphosphatase